MIQIKYAGMENIESWMDLIEVVRWKFPGLETEELIQGYRKTVIKNIKRKSAMCAIKEEVVVGVLLFSKKHNMLTFLAVHPDYRRNQIASRMVGTMLEELDRSRDIAVDTYGEGDGNGIAARAFYKNLGFIEGKVMPWKTGSANFECPQQRFVLKAES